MHDEESLLKLLANATNRAILARLAQSPSYPRAIAAALGASEGEVQRRLHRLQRAGLVRGRWARRHDPVEATVKEYVLAAREVRLDVAGGAFLVGAPDPGAI